MSLRQLILPLCVWIGACVGWAGTGNTAHPKCTPLPSIPSRFAGPQEVVSADVRVLQSDQQVVRLSFGVPEIEVGELAVQDQTFSSIRMNGEGIEEREGAPEVPSIVRMVMVDNTGNLNHHIENSSFTLTTLPHAPAPYVPLEEGDRALDESADLVSPEYYGNDAWYPQEVVTISEPATLRDVRFVLVTVYPVQVNAVTGEMRVYDQVDVAIENIGGSGSNEITHTPTSISPAFKELYRTFPNFEHSYLDELPVLPGGHLYICDPNATVVGLVQNLVDWRRKRGIDAYIRTTTQTGSDATSIRNFILNEFATSNGALEYVTIVGDPDAGAPYTVVTGGSLDNTFATMGGGNPDPVPDLAVGRLPATSGGELGTMINTIIDYESDPYMTETDWYERAWCAAHTSQVPSNPATKQYMRQIMLQHGIPTVDFDVFSGGMDLTTLQSRLEAGVCVFNDRMSWIGEFSETLPASVNVGQQWPYVWVVTCATGTFSGFSPALNEEFVRTNNAIGSVGMSGSGTHSRFNNILDGGGMQTIFALDVRETGAAVVGAKLELYKNYWSVAGGSLQGNVTSFSSWCNLQGDPGVPVYLSIPQTLSVSHPISVTRGTNNVSVTVTSGGNPVANALVGLTKGTETFARGYTNAAGQINLPVGLPTTGTLDIVVTGKDLKAYIGTISVIDVNASLSFNSIAVDDDNTGGTVGDNNDVLNPGETVDLSIVLQNTGTAQTVSGITGTLTTTTPGVTIVNGVQSYPNLNVSAASGPTTPFRVSVGAVFNNEPIALFLAVSSSAGSQTVRVDFTPQAASVAFVSSSFPDGNNRLDPGEAGSFTVTMLNDGSRSLSNSSAILRSLNSYVSVSDSLGTFGNVNPGGNATNAGNPFVVSATIATPGGYQAAMQLVVTDLNGVRDSTNFLLTVGIAAATSPTGPDNYGYFAYENGDIQPPGAAPTYEWIEIAPGLGGTGQSLGFTDGGEDQDDIANRALPFSFTYYGESYASITVCSNGWVAFGNSTQIDYRNFHMGSPLGPPNMIAAYWDDLVVSGVANGGVYVKDDAGNGRYIIEWITKCMWSTALQKFQVILYDPTQYSSPTGDGKILVQYQDVNPDPNSASFDNDYATVGIQNINHTSGLEITYWNMTTPGSTPLADGRAILFTTDITGSIDPHFVLLSPNGGELWLQDSTVNISWSPGLVTGNVNVELSRNGITGPWSSIASGTPNDGQHTYIVSGPASSNCRIRVTSVNTPDSTDISLADFSIASVIVALNEGFEAGAPNWTHSAAAGWTDEWHLSTEIAHVGTTSYKCGNTGLGDHANHQDARLTSPVVASLPADAVLEFWHQIESEVSSSSPDSAYDGGWVEISVDGGAFTTIFPTEGYPKTTRYMASATRPYNGPVPGQPCYAGTVSAWTLEQFDLSSYAGNSVQLRWRFAADSASVNEGWYVDDVNVFSISTIPPAIVPTGLTIQTSGNDVILRWNDDTNVSYRIFSSVSSDPPYLTLEGETSGNSFTIVGGVSASAQKFYYVVGYNGQ